jgi:hypothetical protein
LLWHWKISQGIFYRSNLKKRILVQNRGGAAFLTGGILEYFEDLKRGTNKEFGPKDFFEIASTIYKGRGAFFSHSRCFVNSCRQAGF